VTKLELTGFVLSLMQLSAGPLIAAMWVFDSNHRKEWKDWKFWGIAAAFVVAWQPMVFYALIRHKEEK
jgi:hypothetical protein